MFTKTANRRIQFFFSWFLCDKNRLHSNFLSSNERFIFFNSHLVNGPDFRAHYLNICKLLLRPHRLWWHYERVSLTSGNWRKPFFTQFEYMRNRNIDQDLVNSLFISNSLTRFLEQKHFSSLGSNLYFPVNSSRKQFFFIDPQHGRLVTWLQTKNIHMVTWYQWRRRGCHQSPSADCSDD